MFVQSLTRVEGCFLLTKDLGDIFEHPSRLFNIVVNKKILLSLYSTFNDSLSIVAEVCWPEARIVRD